LEIQQIRESAIQQQNPPTATATNLPSLPPAASVHHQAPADLQDLGHPPMENDNPHPPENIVFMDQPLPRKKPRHNLDGDDDNSIISSEPESTREKREMRAILGLLFARVDPNPPHSVQLATVKKDTDALYNTKTSAGTWTRVHGQAKRKQVDNQHFLATAINTDFYVHPALLRRFMSGQLYGQPLSNVQSLDIFTREVALLHFASPSTAGELDMMQQQIKQIQYEADSSAFDQPLAHQARKTTKLTHFHSFCTSIDAIFSAVANFLVVSDGLVEIPAWGISVHNPTIINYLHQLASLLSDSSARLRISNLALTHRQVFVSVFACFQDVLSAFGNIITNTCIVNTLVHSPDVDIDTTVFSEVIVEFNRSVNLLTLLAKRSELPNIVPLSYSLFCPTKKIDTDERTEKGDGAGRKKLTRSAGKDDGVKHHPGAKGDWILRLDEKFRFKNFAFPEKVGQFCLCFAIQGMTCKRGNDCGFPHIDYTGLKADQKEAIKTYLDNSKAFKLAE
jgi:hypothetical protein